MIILYWRENAPTLEGKRPPTPIGADKARQVRGRRALARSGGQVGLETRRRQDARRQQTGLVISFCPRAWRGASSRCGPSHGYSCCRHCCYGWCGVRGGLRGRCHRARFVAPMEELSPHEASAHIGAVSRGHRPISCRLESPCVPSLLVRLPCVWRADAQDGGGGATRPSCTCNV